jgi:two-component system CheB/CheR fusion protein
VAIVRPAAGERAEASLLPIVVGVGASAGGLEAFTELLSHLPDDSGLAFVLIQHLDPTHESHLTELLSRATRMPVSEVKGETRAEANHVYVIPPRCNLDISDRVLHTPPRPASGRNMPIDSFLRALAADRGSNAVGVILSGTASDGTLGLQAIKAAGGVTFAQEMRTAKFEGMPGSAIAAGVVDFILPLAGIARQLVAIARDSQVPIKPREGIAPPGDAELAKILRLVRSATGVDFTHYKHSTLVRRIKRRMALRGFEKLEDYSRDLEQNREEANALCENCFITVTAFFREPEVFEELKKKVFPALVENRGPEDPIRIWVPGCATGEEAYSIAICLMEFLDDTEVKVPFEIFATDISEAAIEKARAGTYKDSALAHVSPQRLARFFTRTERRYQIAKIIRDVCVFASHNVAQDPPFSKLDLISCCNVLIYLGALLQRKVLSTLHYALKPTGFLVLGPSESIGTLSESFHQLQQTHKIYCMLPAADKPGPRLSEGRPVEGRLDLRQRIAEGRAGPDVLREADRLVLAEHGPPGAIIDDDMNIVQVRGRTAPYLELSPGEPTRNLLKMVCEGLIGGLSKALRTARQSNAAAEENGFRIADGGQLKDVTIKVIPFRASSSSKERYFLVLFEDAEPPGGPRAMYKPAIQDNGGSARLRRELAAAKQYLQSIVEDNATTLEELRAANEEAQKRLDEYWSAHAREKAALESEKNRLSDQMRSLEQEMDSMTSPRLKENENIRGKMSQLRKEQNALGLFKGKEKKALQEKIDSCENYLAVSTAKIGEIENQMTAKIGGLNKRVDEIDDELTRAR